MDTTTRMIRIYAYPRDQDLESPLEMSEVTIVTDPQTLRQLASFLNHAAEQIEQHGDRFGHEHYSSFTKERNSDSPDIVVSRP